MTRPSRPADPGKVGLPFRAFLYSVDQIAVMLDLPEKTVSTHYIFYEGRSTGRRSRDLMIARNIAPEDEKPVWRVAEREVIAWLKRKGYKLYEATVVHY